MTTQSSDDCVEEGIIQTPPPVTADATYHFPSWCSCLRLHQFDLHQFDTGRGVGGNYTVRVGAVKTGGRRNKALRAHNLTLHHAYLILTS